MTITIVLQKIVIIPRKLATMTKRTIIKKEHTHEDITPVEETIGA